MGGNTNSKPVPKSPPTEEPSPGQCGRESPVTIVSVKRRLSTSPVLSKRRGSELSSLSSSSYESSCDKNDIVIGKSHHGIETDGNSLDYESAQEDFDACINISHDISATAADLPSQSNTATVNETLTTLCISNSEDSTEKKKAIEITGNATIQKAYPEIQHATAGGKVESEKLICEQEVAILLEKLADNASSWKMIGLALGFAPSELKVIETKPSLFTEAPKSWLADMLSQWVQWTPETQHGKYATLQDLVRALQSKTVGLAVVAEEVEKTFSGNQSDSTRDQSQHGFSLTSTLKGYSQPDWLNSSQPDQNLIGENLNGQSDCNNLTSKPLEVELIIAPPDAASNTLTSKAPEAELVPPDASASPFDHYAYYLRCYFTRDRELADKWPEIEPREVINLAVISSEYEREVKLNKFREATVHGSIDDILEAKAPILLSDLLKPNCIKVRSYEPGKKVGKEVIKKPPLKRLLVEGAPGIGKSIMSWEICRKWGNGELFQEYSLVVMLRIRDPWVQTVSSLPDLFYYPIDPSKQVDIATTIGVTLGKGLLLIFEGYDEAPPSLRKQSSLFHQLFKGTLLPNATVMVTTRPSASSDLRKHCKGDSSRRVEVLGFGKKEINEYIDSSFLGENSSLREEFYSYLELYPHIHSMMYVPLNSAIVTHVYQSCKTTSTIVPQTMTQLYTALVRTLLLRYMKEIPEYEDNQLNDFNDLPKLVLQKFCKICKLAYNGILEKEIIFTNLPKDFDSLGLMQSIPELYIDKGASVSHNFLHLTIQEYLAAYHLSQQLSEDEQVTFLKENQKSQTTVSRFLAGLIHHSNDNPTSILCKALTLTHTPHGCPEVAISALHMLFEVQQTKISAIFGSQTLTFQGDDTHLPFDYYVLGYCVTTLDCGWKITISKEKDENSEMFVKGMTAFCQQTDQSLKRSKLETNTPVLKHDDPHISSKCNLVPGTVPHIIDGLIQNTTFLEIGLHQFDRIGWKLSISCSQQKETTPDLTRLKLEGTGSHSHLIGFQARSLTSAECHQLAKSVHCLHNLQCFNISQNYDIDHGGAVELIKHLPNSLTTLIMANTSIGEEDCKALRNVLASRNHHIEHLDISHNSLQPDTVQHIIDGLPQSTSLKWLDMSWSNLSSSNVDSLATALKVNAFNLPDTCSLQEENVFSSKSSATVTFQSPDPNLSFALPHTQLQHASRDNPDPSACDSLSSPRNCHLNHLDLSYCRLQPKDIVVIAKALKDNCTLESLNLCRNHIGDEGALAMANMLTVNSTLKRLDLRDYSISEESTKTLVDSVLTLNTTLEILHLLKQVRWAYSLPPGCDRVRFDHTFCNMQRANYDIYGHGGAVELTKHLPNSPISLIIPDTNIGEEDCKALRIALESPNHRIEHLDISHNNLQPDTVQHIIDGLPQSTSLKWLDMSCSSLSSSNVASLATALNVLHQENVLSSKSSATVTLQSSDPNLSFALPHTQLQLASRDNPDPSACDSLSSPRNCHLNHLDLSYCRLQPQDIVVIAKALKDNCTLESLNLCRNHIGDEGALAMANMLTVNSTLKRLDLRDYSISEESTKTLVDSVLTLNTTLEMLYLLQQVRWAYSLPPGCDRVRFDHTFCYVHY